MNGALRELPPEIPEWRRSGIFFAIAITLHLAVLLYPLAPRVGQLENPPPATVTVRLVDAVAPPTPMPMQAAPAIVPKPSPSPSPIRERRAAVRRSAIAMQREQAAPTASFSVPAVAAAAQVPTAELAPAPAMALPAVTPARLEAGYLHNPRPDYPPLSRRLGEEGKVLLRVRVSREGQAAAVDLERSSNFARLDEAARSVVSHWRFVPAKRGDEAIEATVIVPIVFRLEG